MGSSFTKSTESPMLLMTRPRWAATTSAQRDSNSSTRSPMRSREISLLSAVKLTMSANPTVSCVVCRSSASPSATMRDTAAARWRRQA